MFIDQLPGCCGINVIYDFYEGDAGEDESGWDDEGWAHCVRRHKESNAGLLLVALAGYQREQWEPFLLKKKFEIISDFGNPRHGSVLTLYGRYRGKKRKVAR